MRISRNRRRIVTLPAALVVIASLPIAASAQTKIYPPGTDCTTQPTISERLLCGRQELRQQGVSVEEPTGAPQPPSPFSELPARPAELRPAPQEERQPLTASPRH